MQQQLDIFEPRCPSREVLRHITGKWGPMVLIALDDGLTRFGELHRRIGGSSERMLSQTLSALTADGVVTRDLDDNGRPVYGLSAEGRAIAGHLRGLGDVIYRLLDAAGYAPPDKKDEFGPVSQG